MEASALHAPAQLTRPARAGRLLRLRSDDQLLALFRSGSEPAFAVVHDRYQPRLLAYSRQMLGGSRPDAEDVVQDVFLRAYGALRVSTGPVSLRAWLYRVAHNRCIDQLRRPVAPTTEATEATGGVDEDDPSARAQRREDLRQLVVDLRRLPEQQRSALLVRELEGLPYADLAHALGTTVPSVKSLLVRARIGL
ncbi:MAG: sigma-70 family RNA polymerase sigma factor, partial [Solirubrobacterales bacterium]|nr:sigma-70 family RNA polymerase sigma factor [Solirubrobacterales bacterium]